MEFRFGYTDARDKDGFPIYTTKTVRTKEGKLVEVKEIVKVWGKILMPLSVFYCSKCNKPTKEETFHPWWDYEFWYDFYTSDKYNHTKFCLIDGKLYCENCIPNSKLDNIPANSTERSASSQVINRGCQR